jgi:hypothetical protein
MIQESGPSDNDFASKSRVQAGMPPSSEAERLSAPLSAAEPGGIDPVDWFRGIPPTGLAAVRLTVSDSGAILTRHGSPARSGFPAHCLHFPGARAPSRGRGTREKPSGGFRDRESSRGHPFGRFRGGIPGVAETPLERDREPGRSRPRTHRRSFPGRVRVEIPAGHRDPRENTGGHLFKRLDPIQTRVFARFYVKFASDAPYLHHFSGLGGYNPPTNWPQGSAGKRAAGDTRFSARIEPNGDYGTLSAPGAGCSTRIGTT